MDRSAALLVSVPVPDVPATVGEFREIDRPHRVAYSWEWEEGEHEVGETLITVDFKPVEGGTEVVMRHEFFPTEAAAADHTKGWTSCLNRLEALFATPS